MARVERRSRSRQLIVPGSVAIALVTTGGWWLWPREDHSKLAQAGQPALVQEAVIASEPVADNGPARETRPIADEFQHAPEPGEGPPAPQLDGADAPAGSPTPLDEVLEPIGPEDALAQPPPTLRKVEPVPPAAAQPAAGESAAVSPRHSREPQTTPRSTPAPAAVSTHPRVAAALERYRAGQVVEARTELNRLLDDSRDPAEQEELRRQLSRIADETIFSPSRIAGDPLVQWYTVQPGDLLLNIGRRFRVPYEIIMKINGISKPEGLRAAHSLKIPNGPFHARIYKSQFRLDVYLQEVLVRSFRVGLGAERGTPEGVWRVKERLPNPTYFPPASATDKRIIAANDPKNPLGEHWIGLRGVEGDALGQDGYGIHGTIEPESIGKPVSLGCVRMLNEDVAFLYSLLAQGQSSVTILP